MIIRWEQEDIFWTGLRDLLMTCRIDQDTNPRHRSFIHGPTDVPEGFDEWDGLLEYKDFLRLSACI